MNFYDNLTDELQRLQSLGRLRSLPDFQQPWRLNLSSNDYLGVAQKQSWRREFMEQFGGSAGADELKMTASSSRLLTGNHPAYRRLEATLQRLYNGRDALVFNSGYHANIGILPAISTAKDLILSDKLNHASIIDGMKLAEAKFKRYRHGDYEQLEQLLAANQQKYRQIFIITESLFSMDGDIADLRRLVALKKEYQAVLIVDEAHAVGVYGQHGAGLSEEYALIDDIDIIIGTFGKALASLGAYAITNAALKQFLINRMRSFIFTTALPPSVINWSDFVLHKISQAAAARQQLREISRFCHQKLSEHQIATRGSSHIIPVMIGDDSKSVILAEKLRQAGFLLFPIRPPTVPPGTARLRLSLSAEISINQLQEFIDCLCNLIG